MKRGVVLALLATSCGAPPKPAPRVEPAAVAETSAPSFASPARWAFHPTQALTPRARVRLGDGTCVVAAEGGQRWMVAPGRAQGSTTGCSGEARTTEWLAISAEGLPEDLVGVVRRSATAWAFVGASGTIFEASDPLGPFARTLPAPEPLLRVVGAGAVLLATTRDGKLFRWEESTAWHEVTTLGARVFDLGLDESGHALALSLPEALFTSVDAGATWSPAGGAQPPPTVGAQRIGLTVTGELAAVGALDTVAWRPGQTPEFVRGLRARSQGAGEVTIEPGPAASGTAIANGRAFIDGDRYFEVVRREGEGWALSRGGLEGRLESALIPKSEECQSMKLGGTQKTLVATCARMSGSSIVADVLRGDEGGKRWSPALTLAEPDTDAVAIAVAPDGSVLMTGVCKLDPSGAACEPGAPLLLRLERGAPGATRVTAPPLEGVAMAPAFSRDGRSAYFLAHRAKDELLALYVSHDGGETYGERPLATERLPKAPANEDGRGAGTDDGALTPDELHDVRPLEPNALHQSDDGTLGLALTLPSGAAYVSADEDGRGMRLGRPPRPEALVAGWGKRALAISVAGDTAWESLDAGAEWTEIPIAPPLRGDLFHDAPLACGAGGCVVGDAVSRVGWSGQVEQASAPRAHADAPPASGVPAVRTPIVCQAAASSRWIRIDHVIEPRDVWGVPGLREAMRGRSMWSVLTRNPKTDELATFSAMVPDKGDDAPKVLARPMLGKPNGRGPFATAVSTQMEGYALARVAYVRGADREVVPGRQSNVEIAWENWMDGTSGREKVVDGGELGKEDVDPTSDGYNAFLSVSPKGVFLRPRESAPASLWIEPGGKQARFDYPTWPATGPAGPLEVHRDEFAFADGQTLAVGMLAGEVYLLGRRVSSAATGWELSATALAPAQEERQAPFLLAEWSYRGSEVGQTILAADPQTNAGWAYFKAFRGDGSFGPTLALPTPLDLGETPRACSAAERQGSPRLMASDVEVLADTNSHHTAGAFFIGTRHPVLVNMPAEPSTKGRPGPAKSGALVATQALRRVLLTNASVLHGTPASPCVAGWAAIGVGGDAVAAILAGDLRHGFLFRPVTDGESDQPRSVGGAIEYRALTCAFDGAASVPEEIWSEPGTIRTLRP